LGNRAIDEVVDFYQAMHRLVMHLYGSLMKPADRNALNQDVAKLCINIIVKDDVQKVLICMARID